MEQDVSVNARVDMRRRRASGGDLPSTDSVYYSKWSVETNFDQEQVMNDPTQEDDKTRANELLDSDIASPLMSLKRQL